MRFRKYAKKKALLSNIKGNGKLSLNKYSSMNLKKNARIILNGNLILGYDEVGSSKKETLLCLKENSEFIVEGDARIFYGGDIMLFENARFQMGCSYINSNCFIRITESLIIGNGCAISWNFSAMDSDFHSINGHTNSGPIRICDHVWIGANVTILPGVTIGEGSIIAAGAVVNRDIPPNTLAAGIPAKIVKENVEWSM